MSGGHFNYVQDRIACEVFGYQDDLFPAYGEDGFRQSGKAAKVNPLEDSEISEMLWDMIVLLHSYDWYASGDNSEKMYRNDVKQFREKWFGKNRFHRIGEE